MSISRTDIFNFKSKTERDKYITSQKECMKTLYLKGYRRFIGCVPIQSLCYFFSILKSKEHADFIKEITNKLREQNEFDIRDTLVFDVDSIKSVRRYWQ